MTEVVVWLLEGSSILILMMFHFINFKQGALLSSSGEERPYASIKLGEYHFFPDEEVDAFSLADRSSYELEGSQKAVVEQISSKDYAAADKQIHSRNQLNPSIAISGSGKSSSTNAMQE